jgi:DNA ligase-1
MRRFAALYDQLDRASRPAEFPAILAAYFREAPPADAAWALALLMGRKVKRSITHVAIREAAAAAVGLERWLVDACQEETGDLAETIALLLPDAYGGASPDGTDEPLHQVIERRILSLPRLDTTGKRGAMLDAWATMNPLQRGVFLRILNGSLRVGVQASHLVAAMAEVAGVDPQLMAHRISRFRSPDPDDYAALLTGGSKRGTEALRPYPFFSATPLPPETASEIHFLGDPDEWLAEWKWDGHRAQVIVGDGTATIWSKAGEPVTHAFPEVVAAASELPDGTVLDGELLAWENERPLPLGTLHKRILRQANEPRLFPEVPVVFLAQDLLQHCGEDLRGEPLSDRRALLEEILAECPSRGRAIRLSPLLDEHTWAQRAEVRSTLRSLGAHSVLLKRKTSTYQSGRPRGDWWEWKAEPMSVDAVLVMAEAGSGQRSSLFTTYTLAVWDLDELVPIARVASGLDQETMQAIDAWIRQHTLARFGPVRRVEPEHVFEVHFEGIQASDRHRCGLVVRSPRVHRLRADKHIDEADTIDHLRAMLDALGASPPTSAGVRFR